MLVVVAAAVPSAVASATPNTPGGAVAFSTEPGTTQLYSVGRDGSGLRRLTSVFGVTGQAMPSPDRSLVAVETTTDGATTDLAVGSVEDGSYRIVAHADHMTSLSWSADGRWLSYVDFSFTPSGSFSESLWVVRADGSDSRALASAPAIESEWAPTGETLAFSDGSRLRLYDAGTGASRVVGASPDTGVATPAWSPDGRRLAFLRNDRGDLVVYDVVTGAAHVVASYPPDPPQLRYGVGDIDWSPDSRRLAFTTTGFYEFELHVIDAYGGNDHAIGFPGDCHSLMWSPDGSRLSVTWKGLGPGLPVNLEVVRSDLSGRIALASDVGELLWSPEGNELAYGTRDGALMAVSADGSTTTTLVPAPTTGFGGFGPPLGWSQDGSRLFLAGADPGTQPLSQLYAVDAATRLIRPLTWDDGDHEQPVISADGLRVAYVLVRAGERTVVVASLDGSEPVEIGEGAQPALSPDGSQVAFVRNTRIRVTSTQPGGAAQLLARGTWPAWSPDGRLVAYLRSGAAWIANANGHQRRRVAAAGLDAKWGPPTWFGGSNDLYLPHGNGPGGTVVKSYGTSVDLDTSPSNSSAAVSVPSPDRHTIAFEPPLGITAGYLRHDISIEAPPDAQPATLAATIDPVRQRGQLRRRLAWQPSH